jgi:hypothetical protein
MHKPRKASIAKERELSGMVSDVMCNSNPVGAALIINELRQNSTTLDKKTKGVFGSL